MVADKQLIIVVEGTIETSIYWLAIVIHYLEKIIRRFCGKEVQQSCDTNEDKYSFEIAVITYNSLGSYAPVFERVPWTQDMNKVMSSLHTLKFTEGGLDDAPAGDALAEALRLFGIPQNGYHTGGNLDGKRHCVLVASGNPYPYDRWVIKPDIDGCGNTYSCFSDETVARWFAQCSISLSVICPRNIPKLRTLYELAKRNPTADDPLVHVHQSDFVVLISEHFKEALTALDATIPAPFHNALNIISSAPCPNSPNPTSPTLDQTALDLTCTAPHQNTLDPSSPEPHQNDLVPTSPALNQNLDPTSAAPNQYATIQTSQVPNQVDFDPTNLAPSQDALNPPTAVLSQEVLYSSGPAPPQEAVTPLHPELASTSNQPECIPTSKTVHESVGDISTQRLHNEPGSATSLTASCLKPHTLPFLNADTAIKLSLQTISLPALSVNLFCDIEAIQWPDNDVVESMIDTIFKYDICFSESQEITLTAVPDFASVSMGPGSGTDTAASQFVKNQNESFMVSTLIEGQIPVTSELQPSSLLLDTISSMERAPASQTEDILGAKLQNTVLNKSQVVKNSNECPRSGLTTGMCRSVENLNEYSRSAAFTESEFQVAAHHLFGFPQSPYSILGQATSSHKEFSQIEDILGAKLQNTVSNKSQVVKNSNECPRPGLTIGTCQSVENLNEYSRSAAFTKGKFLVAAQHHSFGIPQSPYSILGQATSSHKDNSLANLDKTLLNMPPKFADDIIRDSLNSRFGTTTSTSKIIKKRKQHSKVTTSMKGNIPSTTQKQFSSPLPETTPSILEQVTSHEDNLGVNLPSSLLNILPKSQMNLASSSLNVNLDETVNYYNPTVNSAGGLLWPKMWEGSFNL